jgi:hypothetical protein
MYQQLRLRSKLKNLPAAAFWSQSIGEPLERKTGKGNKKRCSPPTAIMLRQDARTTIASSVHLESVV